MGRLKSPVAGRNLKPLVSGGPHGEWMGFYFTLETEMDLNRR